MPAIATGPEATQASSTPGVDSSSGTPGTSSNEQDIAKDAFPDTQTLAEDREILLRLQTQLTGNGSPLNWGIEQPIADWEGVVTEGTQPRVTELHLASRDLAGELPALLGELSALVVLRLEGNRLSGQIPSRLGALRHLTDLCLKGNALEGCIPTSLQPPPSNDLETLKLPACDAPIDISEGQHTLREGPYQFQWEAGDPIVTFEVPSGLVLEMGGYVHGARVVGEDGKLLVSGIGLQLTAPGTESWIVLDARLGTEWSRYVDGGDSDLGQSFDRLVESAWIDQWWW
ncbi:MAG: hypothetical protein OXH12_00630 [Chloroflexi bacterium]|nr:hypothetical protein [Chloroflexota bacterium]